MYYCTDSTQSTQRQCCGVLSIQIIKVCKINLASPIQIMSLFLGETFVEPTPTYYACSRKFVLQNINQTSL